MDIGQVSVEIQTGCGMITRSLSVDNPDFSVIPAHTNMGNAIAFAGEGTADHITIPHADHLNPSANFTIEFWRLDDWGRPLLGRQERFFLLRGSVVSVTTDCWK